MDGFDSDNILLQQDAQELVRIWYSSNLKKDFVKPENHRALEDIKGSINELAHYRTNFFV